MTRANIPKTRPYPFDNDDLYIVETRYRSIATTIKNQTKPARMYALGSGAIVEMAYIMENSPSTAGMSTSAPIPANRFRSDFDRLVHLARMFRSAPDSQINTFPTTLLRYQTV